MAAADGEVVAAVRAGDESAFAAVVERHRVELLVHCYRMLGSFDEAEDTVQEVFLRAWRAAGGFRGESTLRSWLYRIATNACLDVLRGRARRVLPDQLGAASGPEVGLPPREDIPWLQPFPDRNAVNDALEAPNVRNASFGAFSAGNASFAAVGWAGEGLARSSAWGPMSCGRSRTGSGGPCGACCTGRCTGHRRRTTSGRR